MTSGRQGTAHPGQDQPGWIDDALDHPGLEGQQAVVPPLARPPVDGAAHVRIAPDGTPQAPSACRTRLPGTGDGPSPPCDR